MDRPDRPRGIGRVPQPERSSKLAEQLVTRPQFHYATEGQEFSMEHFMGNKKKAYDPNGDLVSRRESPGESLEETFGRKRRGYTLEAKRNQIPVVKNGDKLYGTVEMSDNFYQKGALVPGSTIQYVGGPHALISFILLSLECELQILI